MNRIGSEIKGLLLLAGILLIITSVDISAVWYYYQRVQSFINKQPHDLKGDAAVLYFGDYTKDEAELGWDSKKRAQTAAALYSQKKIRKIICVGGYNHRFWKGKPHMMKNFLIENHVSACDIIYDSASFNTITNWIEARKMIIKFDFDTVINISSPLHIYRISDLTDLPNNYFATYKYSFSTLKDYWVFYKDVHHEFVSQILNKILKDEIRNKLVLAIGYIRSHFDNIF